MTKKSVDNGRLPVGGRTGWLDVTIWALKNVVAGVIAWFVISAVIDGHQSYRWAYHTLMKGNFKIARENRNLPIDRRWEAKLGYTYAYLRFVRDNTPEDAVILYPTHEVFFPKGKESRFSGEPGTKMIAIRFLYPRKVVMADEIDRNCYGNQLTHVAIANGWGYEHLEYAVDNRADDTVLPIRQPANGRDINQ
jgi:hypothetical protein